jgi:hypothetical protein
MTACAACAGAIEPGGSRSALRSGERVYHVACAPTELLESASEEHRAIVRKGVRYFVEKYSAGPEGDPDVGRSFVELGRAIDVERERRTRA